jgi:hypothetical protein
MGYAQDRHVDVALTQSQLLEDTFEVYRDELEFHPEPLCRPMRHVGVETHPIAAGIQKILDKYCSTL